MKSTLLALGGDTWWVTKLCAGEGANESIVTEEGYAVMDG